MSLCGASEGARAPLMPLLMPLLMPPLMLPQAKESELPEWHRTFCTRLIRVYPYHRKRLPSHAYCAPLALPAHPLS